MSENEHLIGNAWAEGSGSAFVSENPATGETIWRGREASAADVDLAVRAAREAFESWCDTTLEKRIELLERMRGILEERKDELAKCIALETGKLLHDARGEVQAMLGKTAISVKAHNERTGTVSRPGAVPSFTRHKPHGVLGVFGPYNFPAHLPNGHIVPALLAGNTVVFKPSELTPATARKTLEFWLEAGLPPGVINLVQGGRETGKALAGHVGLDGLLFTGSAATGRILHDQFGGQPQKLLALELGGNNPLIVHQASDVKASAYLTIQSAYLTSGQRCTCARRLIVPEGAAGDGFIAALVEMIGTIRVGACSEEPEAFMGPVINLATARKILDTQERWLANGGRALVRMEQLREGLPFLSPGLVDMSAAKREDEEIFGPLLQVIRVRDFDAAIVEANNTAYGLSAGLFSDSEELYREFYRRIRAGIVNWNRPLTGASGAAPFGGAGISGNHFPSAYYAADYCSYPVASMEANTLEMPKQTITGMAP